MPGSEHTLVQPERKIPGDQQPSPPISANIKGHTKPIVIHWYVMSDFLCSAFAWALFYIWRKTALNYRVPFTETIKESTFLPGLILVPIIWIALSCLLVITKKLCMNVPA
jgi:hypothetical protein